MRLSEYSDYTLRVLMHCARQGDRRLTIADVADTLQVSKNHLMKVVNDLSRQGLLEATRGRGGGIRLLKSPNDIRIGDVLRRSETDFRLVECFDPRSDTCTLTRGCLTRHVLGKALDAFFAQLDAVTLAQVTDPAPTPLQAPVTAPLTRRKSG